MGSPYESGFVTVEGGYFDPDLEELGDFQNKYAVSADGKICYIPCFDMEDNLLSFRVVKISDYDKTIELSDQILGGCNEIEALPDRPGVRMKVWHHEMGMREVIVEHFNKDTTFLYYNPGSSKKRIDELREWRKNNPSKSE